ncbi:tRNA-guanine(15) transglycosylase-like protein [Scenedesmus sp. NREL 46B-D3]|nr:tRNA-guanine(15) transglycosylase-like protein [Scenedesmus sp. NREL 46B-D3]
MFKATAQDGLARCGLMVMKSTSNIVTPTPMLYTRRGGCLFLTPDNMDKLRPDAQMVQINAMQFIHLPSPDIIKSYGRSVHHYLGIPSWPVFASNRDPTMTEYFSAKSSNNTAVYATLYTGGTQVTPERYMQAIAALQPDMYVALADEVPGDARPKRVGQSVDRTIKWLDECIQHHQALQQQQQQQKQQQQKQQQAEAAARVPDPQLFAAIVGAASEQERVRSAKAAAGREVAGFALCGFGMGEPAAARPGLMAAALQHLPADKPRVVVGLASPEEVLEAVSQGVDLFDCSYPTHATAQGYALCFPLRQHEEQQQQQDYVDTECGADDSKLNLWSLQYRADKGPLVQGCSCFACRSHSRAYLHHLLHTHEMLASVLLELHNTHWWLGFFGAVQEAIQAGQLQQYVAWFKQRRQAMQQPPDVQFNTVVAKGQSWHKL